MGNGNEGRAERLQTDVSLPSRCHAVAGNGPNHSGRNPPQGGQQPNRGGGRGGAHRAAGPCPQSRAVPWRRSRPSHMSQVGPLATLRWGEVGMPRGWPWRRTVWKRESVEMMGESAGLLRFPRQARGPGPLRFMLGAAISVNSSRWLINGLTPSLGWSRSPCVPGATFLIPSPPLMDQDFDCAKLSSKQE